MLERNTTQNNTKVQQRDALIDYIQNGRPLRRGPDDRSAPGLLHDTDCANISTNAVSQFVCACPESVTLQGAQCVTSNASGCAGKGQCVLAQCRDDVAAIQVTTCQAAPTNAVQTQCENSLSPCVVGGETCKYLACVDQSLGNFSDNRIEMVGQ